MSAAGFAPLREWEPALKERVVRWNRPGVPGEVRTVDRYGHFADPYWLATVVWEDGHVEPGIETSSLVREDGSQGRR